LGYKLSDNAHCVTNHRVPHPSLFFAKGGIRRTPTKPTLPWRQSKWLATVLPFVIPTEA
jgi:hypothetical protein